jgi:hypothetical protein
MFAATRQYSCHCVASGQRTCTPFAKLTRYQQHATVPQAPRCCLPISSDLITLFAAFSPIGFQPPCAAALSAARRLPALAADWLFAAAGRQIFLADTLAALMPHILFFASGQLYVAEAAAFRH